MCELSSKTVTITLPPHERGKAWFEVEATLARAHLTRDPAPFILEQGRAGTEGTACI